MIGSKINVKALVAAFWKEMDVVDSSRRIGFLKVPMSNSGNSKNMELKWGEVNFSSISACKWVACTHCPQPSGSPGNYYDERRKMGFGTFHWIDLENCWVSMSCQLSEPKCAWFQGFTIVNHLKHTWQDYGQGWDDVVSMWNESYSRLVLTNVSKCWTILFPSM